MSTKKHISKFGKTYEYLLDPESRSRETGDTLLTVDGAYFAGDKFAGMDWRNVLFKNCDFEGAYEVKPMTSTNVRYEDCRFAGVFGYGKATQLHFLRCAWASESNAYAGEGSQGVLFESCKFLGSDSDANHWGAVGSDGEAEFVKCSAKYFSLDGHAKLIIRDCDLNNVTCSPTSRESGGIHAEVLVERCKLGGLFDMRVADLQSLTIRDTALDHLDLSGATVKGDVLIERVKGGVVKAGVESALGFVLRDSQIYGPGNVAFVMALEGAERVLIDNVRFASGVQDKVGLGAGRPLKPSEWSAMPRNKQSLIRNCNLPIVDASWLESQHLRLEANTIGMLDLSNSRIGKLELVGNTIDRTFDLSNTQVEESKLPSFAKGQVKLDGSNIKLY